MKIYFFSLPPESGPAADAAEAFPAGTSHRPVEIDFKKKRRADHRRGD